MRKIYFLIAVIISIILFSTVGAIATNRYVKPDGLCGGNTPCYPTIQAAIAASSNGDIIEVDAGTYTIASGTQLNINKQITLRAKAGLSAKPIITTQYASWTGCAVQISANNVVIDGFEITSSYGITQNPNDLVGDYYTSSNNWTVKNCDIHQGYRGIMACGNNITIQGNEIHETRSDCIDCEYGLCGGLKVTQNWLHSEHTDLLPNAKPAGITYNCDATTSGDVEISCNYCNSCRTFVDFQHNGGTAPANKIVIMHNTIDWNLTVLPSSPIPSSTIAQLMGIAFWTGTSGNWWDASKIDIRDNIFSRLKYYAIVNTSGPGGLFAGSLNIRNNLFFQWYLVDAYYPSQAYTYEWPATRGAVAWWYPDDAVPTFTSDIVYKNPLFKATGTTAGTYYSLLSGSPAFKAASDGTNIGAWQTPPVHNLIPDLYFYTIPDGIASATNGDTVEVDAGTYNVGTTQILINKSITLRAKAGLSSKPIISTSYTSYNNCAVSITSNNVVVDGFEIDGSSAFPTFPTNPIGASTAAPASCYLIGDYNGSTNVGVNNWTVQNCYIHNCRDGIRMSSNNGITIRGNEISKTIKDCINARNGNCYGLTVTYNWLHSELPDPQGGKPAGIGYNCDHTSGADVEISYNYCSACRTFCDFQQSNNGDAPTNNIRIIHNTVDWDITSLPTPVQDISKGQLWAIAWWASPTTNHFNASKFIINDNIFSRSKFYALASSTGTFIGQIQLNNNLFSQFYLCDAFYPGPDSPTYTAYVKLPNEWPSERGAVGWNDYGANNGFTFPNDTLLTDPLYKATGNTAVSYYALAANSPAHLAASDGTDIGAWQTPTPPMVSTTSISNIQTNSATGGGNVVNDNGSSITARGVCWSTSSNPAISDYHTIKNGTTGIFSSNITGLSAGTTYYVKAYATNAGGTAYGDEVTFTTIP